MIKNKEELKYFIERDALADGNIGKRPKIFGGWPNKIWKYKILLRKSEYYKNIEGGILKKILSKYYLFRYTLMGIKLGFTIPMNVVEEGLSIPHYGTIIINGATSIGKNCRIMADVCIGSTNGINEAAKIGDNVYIGAGAKIIGNVTIGDNVCIGANSVVTSDIVSGITVAGVPAKKISDRDSKLNINKRLYEL